MASELSLQPNTFPLSCWQGALHLMLWKPLEVLSSCFLS